MRGAITINITHCILYTRIPALSGCFMISCDVSSPGLPLVIQVTPPDKTLLGGSPDFFSFLSG